MTQSIELSADLLYKGLQAYRFAYQARYSGDRENLTCLKLIVNKASLRIVATDGHALAIFDTKIGYDDQSFDMYISGKSAKEIATTLKKNRDSIVTITQLTSNDVEIKSQNSTFIAEYHEDYADFPPYEKIIPSEDKAHTGKLSIAILELERITAYLKAVFAPSKKHYESQSGIIDIPAESLAPITFRSTLTDIDDISVKIVQMPTRLPDNELPVTNEDPNND